jgi:hypothetical protein
MTDRPEKRSARRMKRNKSFAIINIDGKTHEFQVADVSARGLKLLDPLRLLPATFELTLVPNMPVRPARLVWRKANFVGVEFMG